MQKGIEYFQHAIEKDPNDALAYARLGNCFSSMNRRVEAKEALLKALQLDKDLGEHTPVGFFRFVYEWDFAGAEGNFCLLVMPWNVRNARAASRQLRIQDQPTGRS